MLRFAVSVLALAAIAALPARGDELEIDFSELDNGLDLILVEKHDVPLVTIEVAVKTGSFTELPHTNGLSHLYEHMFFKGNAALPTQEAYMARMSELGITFNGTTSTERVNYFVTLPSRNFAPGMEFMADALLSPLFNEEELVKERRVVIGEYDRNEANPQHFLREGLREHLYGDQAYRKNPLGEREVILSATADTMRAFKEEFYVPNNSALLIVGDVNRTEAKVLAEQLFGPRSWARGPDPHAVPRAPLPRLSETETFLVEQPTEVVTMSAAWPGPDVGRDERATFVADVWGTLCGLQHARFQRTFRESGLTNAVNLYYYTQREGGEISFSAVVRDPARFLEVRDTMLDEVAAMAEAGYWSAEEIALAKRNLRISRAFEAESGEDFCHTLSFWWASAGFDYYRRYLDETDSVTAEELREFARNYLVGRPFVLGALASEENADEHGITAEALRPKASAVSQAAAAASAVEELEVGDGLRVIFRREPGSAIAAFDLYVDGGCLTLTEDTQGIDGLLIGSLLDGSVETPRDELLARLVALGARTSSDTNYDYSRLSLSAPREGFGEALGLVAECLREPRFAREDVARRRDQMITALESERADPDRYVVRKLNEAFFAGHPYANRPDGAPAALQGFGAEDLRDRLGEVLTTERTLGVLVADMTTAEARALLEAHLGFFPATKPWSRPAVPEFAPRTEPAFEQRDIPTTYVIAKTAAPSPGEPDYAATRLALRLLRKRLWETLRTKHALVYATSAGISIYRGNYAYLYCSTSRPEEAIPLMHEDLRRLQRQPIDPAELQGLIVQEETRAWTSSESAAGLANGLGRAELTAGSWRHHYEAPLDLAGVTPAEVQAAARRYLKGFTWGLIGPEPVPEEVLRGPEEK